MRPAGLTAVCVICLSFGVIGGFTVVGGIVTTFLQPVIMEFTEWIQGKIVSSQPARIQQQMQQQFGQQDELMQEMMDMQGKWLWFTIARLSLQTVAAVALVVGAVKGLGMKPQAHRWMITGMSLAIVHALFAGWVDVGIQGDTQVITTRYIGQTLQTTPGAANPAMRSMMSSTMQATAAITVAFLLGWALLKCGCYGVCIGYLLTPRIRKLFESDGSERAIIDALSAKPT